MGAVQVSRERRGEAMAREAAKTAAKKEKCISARICSKLCEEWSVFGDGVRGKVPVV